MILVGVHLVGPGYSAHIDGYCVCPYIGVVPREPLCPLQNIVSIVVQAHHLLKFTLKSSCTSGLVGGGGPGAYLRSLVVVQAAGAAGLAGTLLTSRPPWLSRLV